MELKIKNYGITLKVCLISLLISGLIFSNGCAQKKEQASDEEAKEASERLLVKKSDKVKVQYIGRLADGTVFDKSNPGAPFEFIVGSGKVIRGFDKAVEGMKLNEEKRVTLKAEDAYGERNESLIREFPRVSFSDSLTPEVGMIIRLQDSAGRAMQGKIIEMNDNNVYVDLNHPLAGKDLTFDIKVVAIE